MIEQADTPNGPTIEVRVWDLPVRVSHWLLVLALTAAVVTGELGGALIDWHGRIGLVILGVVAFRLAWGGLGSTYARFASFFPTPQGVAAYLRGCWRGLGHNPIGGLAVFALLSVSLGMVGTGLFANDDIAFQGPLAVAVAKETSDHLTGWHSRILLLLGGLTALHVGAMAFYARVKRVNLVIPMVTGTKAVAPDEVERPVEGGGPARCAVALVLAGLVAWVAGSDMLAKRLSGSGDRRPPAEATLDPHGSSPGEKSSDSVAASTGTPGW